MCKEILNSDLKRENIQPENVSKAEEDILSWKRDR